MRHIEPKLHGECIGSSLGARASAVPRKWRRARPADPRVAEVLAERKLFAEVFETTDAFVQVIDTNYNFLAINKANADEYERVFGLRPQVGDNLLDLLASHDEAEIVEAAWAPTSVMQ